MIDEKKLIEEIEKEIDGVIVKDTYSKGKNAGLRKARILAEEQSKIGVWIPCSERLPEERQDVLVFDAYNNMYIAHRILSTFFDNEMNDINVIAWQPLPEAYHG